MSGRSDSRGRASSTDLCVLGDFAWDVLIRTNTELLRGGDTFGEVSLMPGGSAANVAVWAARCGQRTHFAGKIGRDRFGELARENLDLENVEAHLVDSESHATGSVAVFVDASGERSMVSGHGADFYLLPSEVPLELVRATRHLHLTAWSFFTDPPRAAVRAAARAAADAGSTVSFDPGSFQMIEEMGVDAFLEVTTDLGIDLFLPNKEEGYVLTGLRDPVDMARTLADVYVGALVVLKLDADGALVLIDGEAHHIPAGTSQLVDATGAGDSFAGSFLAHWLRHGDPVAATRFAVQVSAWVIQRPGARPGADARLEQILRSPLAPR